MGVRDGEELTKLLNGDVQKEAEEVVAHPELRGGRKHPITAHSFSPRQMKALAAICDTIVPSIQREECEDAPRNAATAAFLRTSASEAGIVPEVAAMLCAWTTRFNCFLAYMALLLLSTRLGTLMLAGMNAITWEFPFLHAFHELPLYRRERILLAWASSRIVLLQMLFKVAKCYTVFKFYSRADEQGRNPAWDAIGYSIPPPPPPPASPPESALEKRMLDAKEPGRMYARLASLGCTMLDDVSHLYPMLRTAKAAAAKQRRQDFGVECDVAVVGSGCGGAVIAARLAAAGYKVVVLEKGAYFPPDRLSLLEGPSMAAMYEQSGALTTIDGSAILLAGTTLGGGSTVNWSASLRTPPHVTAEWAAMGLPRFGEGGDYAAAMDAVCQRLGVQDKPPTPKESFQNAALRLGCQAMGYPIALLPRNAGVDHDCGFCGFGCRAAPSSRKRSAAETWLTDAAASGAVVITGCKAEAFLLSRSCRTAAAVKPYAAHGVYCAFPDCGFFVSARACVTACGSLFTPPLLRRSGLSNPHIGRHLCIHPVATAWGYFPQGNIPPGKSYEGGIMTAYSTASANWTTTGYGSVLQTPSLHPGTYSVIAPWCSGGDHKRRILRFPRTATIIAICRDRGRGTVREDDCGKLLLDCPLYSADKQSLAQGVAAALRVLAAAGADEVGTNCIGGESFTLANSSREGFEDFVERVTKGMFSAALSTPIVSAHQLGSCRMGKDAQISAIDPKCETWEVEGLFVGDGSALPTASGVNPMITIQSVAYCTADSIDRFLQERV